MEGSLPQIEKWEVTKNDDGTVNAHIDWIVRTPAGNVARRTSAVNQDPATVDLLDEAKAFYTTVVDDLELSPHLLTFPAVPGGKLRYGFSEDAP